MRFVFNMINVNYRNNQYINFNGHEPRKLKCVVLQNVPEANSNAIFNELNTIAEIHKLRVLRPQNQNRPWLQDEVAFSPKGKIFEISANMVESFEKLGLANKKLEPSAIRICGGNLFFTTNKNGKKILFIGEDGKNIAKKRINKKEIGVDKIVYLPQSDFHLDLFMCPIGDGKILVANDDLTLDVLEKIKQKISSKIDDFEENKKDGEIEKYKHLLHCLTRFIDDFRNNIDLNTYKATKDVKKILKSEGFEIIDVPGRIYSVTKLHNEDTLKHKLNYLNALTFKDKNNETVFITNKTRVFEMLDKIVEGENISKKFDHYFKRIISKHIKPQNIYFLSGMDYSGRYAKDISDILYESLGGLHCMCCEVPDDNK